MSLSGTYRDRRNRVTLVLWAALAVSLVAFPPAHADLWYQSYDKAKEAIEAEDWNEAIRQINLALEQKGDPDARARTYGMNFEAYFPYYKLGVAYHKLGQLDAALQALETEERLGAIVGSQGDYDDLQGLRRLILKTKEDASAEERQRREELVAESLARVEQLEGEGRYDEALTALGNAQALAPDAQEVTSTRARILNAINSRREQQDRQDRIAQLVAQGRSELQSGQYQKAALTFNRALSLESTSLEVRALALEAQDRLREQLAALESAEEQQRTIADGLRAAATLEQDGDLLAALGKLQSVLALDPGNREASAIHTRLLVAQAAIERDASNTRQLEQFLSDASAAMEAKEFGVALDAANRVLALEPQNPTAQEYVATAFRMISRTLLGQNMAPMISFWMEPVGEQRELNDGTRAEFVRDPNLILMGNVLDESEVELTLAFDNFRVGAFTKTPTSLAGITQTFFLLRHHVSSGFTFKRRVRTTFTVTATDQEGAKSTDSYVILYEVPLVRSLWLYSALAVTLLGLIATLFASRIRRRNRIFKRRFNPYIAGAPVVKDNTFFGRERLMSRVLQTIHNNSILLYGERRIGKTSFQHRLRNRLESIDDRDYTFYPVYTDLQGTPEEKFFATLAEDVFHQLEALLDGCKPNPALHDGDAYQYREFVRDLRAIFKVLETKTDKKVKLVLLIDEVDELNAYDPRINQRLRSLFMKSFAEKLVAVVSGVAIKRQWESEGSPWYNFFEEVEVKPFQKKDAEELICKPIRGIFRLENGVVDAIISMTGCRPYLIQKTCIQLVTQLHEQGRRRITLADVEAVGPPVEE